jgi:hypothetical protein
MLHSGIRRIATAILLACLPIFLVTLLGLNSKTAYGDLPPRPETPPAPIPTPVPSTSGSLPGSAIELYVEDVPTGPEGVWTVVEWQDPHTGQWNAVEGWQGTVEQDGRQTWWVAPKDYGTGPFRWVVLESKEADRLAGDPIAISNNFTLPQKRGETIVVLVTP